MIAFELCIGPSTSTLGLGTLEHGLEIGLGLPRVEIFIIYGEVVRSRHYDGLDPATGQSEKGRHIEVISQIFAENGDSSPGVALQEELQGRHVATLAGRAEGHKRGITLPVREGRVG